MKKLLFLILFSLQVLSVPNYIYEHMKNDNPKLKDGEIEWIYNKVNEYSIKYNIDPILVIAVMDQESSYNHKTVSSAGAMGLMQIMPETARELKINPYKAEENIEGGIIHLKQMLDRYHGKYKIHYGLAAYNAGAGAVKKYKGIPPYRETQDYVRKVVKNYNKLRRNAVSITVNQNLEKSEEKNREEIQGAKRKTMIFESDKKISFYKGSDNTGNKK